MGAKKKPFYRIIVTEKRSKRDGRFVESVGYYDPCRNPANVKIEGGSRLICSGLTRVDWPAVA